MTGPDESLQNGLGVGGERLHEWAMTDGATSSRCHPPFGRRQRSGPRRDDVHARS